MPNVAVVGGGFMGLTMALRLAQRGATVTLYERGPRTGGLAQAEAIGGFRWDAYYHVILLSDLRLRDLLDEIGLSDRLVWGTTRTGFYVDGRWHSMSSALDFLRFPPLNLIDKARLGLTILYASQLRDWRALEQVSALDWLRRLSGDRTVRRVWEPLLRAKLGDNASEASAAFIWAIIARMYGARRSGLKREMMGYVEGGYDTVLPRLQRHVENAGVRIVCGQGVRAVEEQNDSAIVTTDDGVRQEFDHAVLTVSCPRIVQLCPQLLREERQRLMRVRYQGVACPSFLLRRPLSGYYVTNITDRDVPFTGLIEMTALVDPETFGGHTLVYLPLYLTQNDPRWELSDDEIATTSFAALRRMCPELRDEDLVASRVARARDVLAISTIGYSDDAMPPLRTSMSRVFIANSAQIANGTLNVNETVTLANRQAAAVMEFVNSTPTAGVHA